MVMGAGLSFLDGPKKQKARSLIHDFTILAGVYNRGSGRFRSGGCKSPHLEGGNAAGDRLRAEAHRPTIPHALSPRPPTTLASAGKSLQTFL